jgi:RNA polymerase sigma-70 factor, ECF subfamily
VSCLRHPDAVLRSAFPRSLATRAAATRRANSPRATAMVYSNPPIAMERSLQLHSFDAGYVENLCQGDPRTQEHFVGYFSALLKVKLRSRLQSRQVMEDVCQETFARVFAVLRKDGGLRDPERLGAFVNSVCNHVLLETYRSSSRVESLDAEGRPEPPAAGPDALAVVVARQSKEKVREILLGMAPRDRFLLKAVFLEQRDRDEVCREFGVGREYLRVLLHRAKEQFKTEFVKRFGGHVPLDSGGERGANA